MTCALRTPLVRTLVLLAGVSLLGCPGTDAPDAGLDAPIADTPMTPVDTPAHDAPSDAPVLEACPTPGATRVGACGNCGMASQTCTDGFWVNTSACLMQGECPAGTAETMLTDRCAEMTRLCSATCGWSDWEETRPESGTCVRGQLRFAYDAACGALRGRYETCGDTCEYVADPGAACTDGCGDTARTSPAYAREVCVPGGTFIRGVADYYMPPDTGLAYGPESEVYVSAFYIDVYPVTNQRYQDCVDAGGCTTPDFTTDPLDRVFSASPSAAWNYFCEWDGGRRMPTDAELAKAARGPAPRRNWYPWDGLDYRCDLIPSYACGAPDADPARIQDDPYDGMPGSRSFYGVERLYGAGFEVATDVFSLTYYALPESRLPDPTGPSGPGSVTIRGTAYGGGAEGFTVADRADGGALDRLIPAQFRCVRPVEVP